MAAAEDNVGPSGPWPLGALTVMSESRWNIDAARIRDHDIALAPEPESLLAVLADTVRLLSAGSDRDDLMQVCLGRLAHAFDVDRLVVVKELHDARSRASHYQVVREWARAGRPSYRSRGFAVLPADRAVLFASVCRTGLSFQGGLHEVPSPQREILEVMGTANLACAAFAVGGHSAGLLCIEDERPGRVWARGEIDGLFLAAQALWALHQRKTIDQRLLAERERAMELARELTRKAEEAQHAAVSREQERSVQSRAAELARANRILREAAARIASATDLRSIATVFMREATRASDADAAALYLERAGGFELVMVAEHGQFREGAALECISCIASMYEASRQPGNSHFRKLHAGQPVWRFVNAPDADWCPDALAYHAGEGHQAVWDVPFSAEGKVVGYLSLAFSGTPTPLSIVAETVSALANQISVGLELTATAARLRDSEVREAVSNERSRMARDIHDNLAQSFSSIAMQSEALLAGMEDPERVRRTLERIADTARLGISEARATALALRPLENRIGALDEALAGLAHRCTVQGGMACNYRVIGTPILLSLDVQEALLRIAQEALSNALRHSGGTRVTVEVDYGGVLRFDKAEAIVEYEVMEEKIIQVKEEGESEASESVSLSPSGAKFMYGGCWPGKDTLH